MIQDEDELESDMCDADTYQTTLEQQITHAERVCEES